MTPLALGDGVLIACEYSVADGRQIKVFVIGIDSAYLATAPSGE